MKTVRHFTITPEVQLYRALISHKRRLQYGPAVTVASAPVGFWRAIGLVLRAFIRRTP